MTSVLPSVAQRQQFIDGEWGPAASGETFERTSPYDGRVLATYPDSDVADAERAIRAARRAFDETSWPTGPAAQRATILRRAADLIRERRDDLARSISEELGRPISQSSGEVLSTASLFEYYAGKTLDLRGDAITAQNPNALGLILKEPVGVVAMITPWNFPLSLIGWKVGPAIAAGCTMVSKPSHYTPGAALLLAEILAEAGLPDGVFNVVTTAKDNGALVGQYLASSDLVDKVAFTGSGEAGKAVMRAAAGNVKKVSLELGGKSPNIILPDAPLDAAVRGAFTGIYGNTGQVCSAGSRLLLSNRVRDEFMERLVDMTKTVRLGNPLDPETTMGPVVNERQLARVEGYIERGKEEANLVTGGYRATDEELARGHFIVPTIFDEVETTDTIAREEVFGPVLSVLSFEDIDDVVRVANDTMYGLAAAVWTRDINAAIKVAKGVRAGTVYVNAYGGAGLSNMPFGGYRQSGLGRELGPDSIDEYMETKSVHIRLD